MWALGSVGVLSAIAVLGSGKRGGRNLSNEEEDVLHSLENAIMESGDPQATRLFYPTDPEWRAVQSLISRGLAKEKKWPGGHYFVGFGITGRQKRTTGFRTRCCGAHDTYWDELHVCRKCHDTDPQMVDEDKPIEVAITDRGIRVVESGSSSKKGSGNQVSLGQVATVKKNFKGADFWLKKDGSPTKEFNKTHIGIKVNRTDLILPSYLYYAMMSISPWANYSPSVDDIRAIALG